jgi:hypothetical protein
MMSRRDHRVDLRGGVQRSLVGASHRVAWALLLSAAAVMILAGQAIAAAPIVYHSPLDDGAAPGSAILLPPGGVQTLFLYGDGGPAASTSGVVCEDGSGDEICSWDLLVEAREGTTLVAFRPEGDLHFSLTASALRFNGGSHQLGSLGATKLGELDIDTSADGRVDLTGGQAVGAGLQLHDLHSERLIIVPEPSGWGMLAAGMGFLAVLYRVRTRKYRSSSAVRRVD